MELLRYDTLHISNIEYKKPEKRGQSYYSDISYQGKPLMLICPKMQSKISGEQASQKSSPSLELETSGQDYSFYDFMLKVDEKNIRETHERGKEWFDKDIPLELIDDMYKRTNKPVKRNQKPIFIYKLPVEKQEICCKVYNQDKEECSFTNIQIGTELVMVLHIKGLKFLKQHYYCDCYLSQIQIYQSKNKYVIPDECLLSDDEGPEGPEDLVDEDVKQKVIAEINTKREGLVQKIKEYEQLIQEKIEERNDVQKDLDEIDEVMKDM